jgi:hypothetical protein
MRGDEPKGGEGGPGIERIGDGEEGQGGGEAAAGEVGVHEEERCSGDGESPKGAEQTEAGELRDGVGDAAGHDLTGGEEGEPEGEEIDEEDGPGEGDVGEADEGDERGDEEGEAEVLGDEGGVVGEEGGVKFDLDSGEVEAAVFCQGVVAMDEEREEGEREEESVPGGGAPVRRRCVAGRGGSG